MIITGTGGSGLSSELLHMIEELGTQLERDHREAAKQEAATALRQGLKEADALRSAASTAKTGAFVSGLMTGVGGAAQLSAATSMKTSAPSDEPGLASFGAHNNRADQLGRFGGTLAQTGQIMNHGYVAAADMDRADSREAAARAEAAARHSESEQSAAEAAQRTVDKAREIYGQITELEHASVMASLRA
ncbi:MAG TPA: hypothetical protein VI072_17270 [Polyangiaceae bacterium]